jgi:N6-adenosine-specific RNA methylase IME4
MRSAEDSEGGGMTYACTSLDCPWAERGGGKIKRGADKHYPVMSVRDIERTIIRESPFDPAPNAHVWMWATDGHLPDALWLMGRLDFEFKRSFVWVKSQRSGGQSLVLGLGRYGRGAHELLLLGVRGKGQHEDVWTGCRSVPSVFFAPHERVNGKRIHSRKPQASYELIERVSNGPRLELFARCKREGWDSWGNEVAA